MLLRPPLVYHRSGFDCKILLIVNYKFFHTLPSKDMQKKEYVIYIINAGTVCVCVCVSVRPCEISGTERHIAMLLSLV